MEVGQPCVSLSLASLLCSSLLLGCFWPQWPQCWDSSAAIIITATHWHKHARCHTHTYKWMYSCVLTCTSLHIYSLTPSIPTPYTPLYIHILHFTFHISTVMLLCHKAPHPSRVLRNNWWMVTQQVEASMGGPIWSTCSNMGPFASQTMEWKI